MTIFDNSIRWIWTGIGYFQKVSQEVGFSFCQDWSGVNFLKYTAEPQTPNAQLCYQSGLSANKKIKKGKAFEQSRRPLPPPPSPPPSGTEGWDLCWLSIPFFYSSDSLFCLLMKNTVTKDSLMVNRFLFIPNDTSTLLNDCHLNLLVLTQVEKYFDYIDGQIDRYMKGPISDRMNEWMNAQFLQAKM